jgi:hypothetical protein
MTHTLRRLAQFGPAAARGGRDDGTLCLLARVDPRIAAIFLTAPPSGAVAKEHHRCETSRTSWTARTSTSLTT